MVWGKSRTGTMRSPGKASSHVVSYGMLNNDTVQEKPSALDLCFVDQTGIPQPIPFIGLRWPKPAFESLVHQVDGGPQPLYGYPMVVAIGFGE